MLSPSVKSEVSGCHFTTANPWFNGARDLSTARAAAEWGDPHKGLKWPPWRTGPVVCLWKADPGKARVVITQSVRRLPLRPRANNNSATLRVKPAHGAESMGGTPASSQPGLLCSSLVHSSLMLGETQRCRRNPLGMFWELWHHPQWQQRPSTGCYLLPSSIPWHFPTPLTFSFNLPVE